MNIPTSSFPTDADQAGIFLIRSLGIPPMDAFLLLKDLLDTSRGRGDRITRAKRCIRLGGEALADREKSVSFSQAVRASLEARKHRRPRTLQEIRCMAARMMKKCPELARKQVRSITPEDCGRYLRKSFSTPRQRHKGRLILSGILNYSLKRGWCRRNAAFLVPPPILREKRIRALSLYEAKRLLHTAEQLFRGGMPAGLRPDAVRGYTPPRGQKADVEAYQSEIRPGFTGAHPYQNGREPPCFHPSRAGFHPQPDVFRRFPRPFRLPAQLGKEMEGSKAPVRHPEKKRMGSGRAEAYLRLLPPGPFLQSKPSPEGDGTLLPPPCCWPAILIWRVSPPQPAPCSGRTALFLPLR